MKVKNTFLEFDDELDEDHLAGAWSRRQMSEPSPSTPTMFHAFCPDRFTSLPPPTEESRDKGYSTDQSTEAWVDSALEKVCDKGYETDDTFGPRSEDTAKTPSRRQSSEDEPDQVVGFEALGLEVFSHAASLPAESTSKKGSNKQSTQKAVKAFGQGRQVQSTSPVSSWSAPEQIPGWKDVYTVMMRNLPNKYTQKLLVEEIHEAGFKDAYDFLYLPMDHQTGANRGYAFINFVTPQLSQKFKQRYEGASMKSFNSTKIVTVNPAALQGFNSNYEHYSTARVNRAAPGCRPIFLREPYPEDDGVATSQRRGRGRRAGAAGGASAIDVAVQKQMNQQERRQPQQNSQAFKKQLQEKTGPREQQEAQQQQQQQQQQQPNAYWQTAADSQDWCMPLPGMQVRGNQSPGLVNFCSLCGLVAEHGTHSFCRACGGTLHPTNEAVQAMYGQEMLMSTCPATPPPMQDAGNYGYAIAGMSPSYY